MGAGWWVREVSTIGGDEPEGLPMPEAIRKVRDEITALAVIGNDGEARRALSMVLARLDEARLWATEYGVIKQTHLVVDKREYLRQLTATAPAGTTVTTVDNGGGNNGV